MLKAMKESEAKLVEMAMNIREEATQWRAVHFRFSQLLERYRSEYQIKIAVNLVDDLLKGYQGGVFVCVDADIFLLCRAPGKALLDKLIFQLRYLFMDDPLAYDPDGKENESFCRIYDLGVSWEDVSELCKRKLSLANKSDPRDPNADRNAPRKTVRIMPMTPKRLASLEQDLLKADVSRVLREQPICAIPKGKPITQLKPVFEELYINIAHLRRLLMQDVDFTSNRWLFKYITQVLDQRVLETLKRRPDMYFDTPVSLNLNVETLLSERFAEFDAAIKPETKVSIVIELQVADIFSDMSAFMIAKDGAQKLGYRVCLDGLTYLSFHQVDRESLGFDLAKLMWNADMKSDLDTPQNRKLAKAIERCGPNRMILCRCDSQEAVDFGHALGISLFQGRAMDKILNPNSKVEN